MSFPNTLDDFTPKVDSVDDVMAQDVNELQTAIEALEAKVGIDNSLDTDSLDYLLDEKVPTTRTLSTTAPLTGGGDLSANRTLAINDATTAQKGAVQLTDSTSSTSTTTAATPNSVKSAYDLANGKAPTASPTFTGTVTLADNARVDLTLPTADTYCTGNTTDSFAAGYSSAVGDLVFFGSGGKWLEVDADAVATCKGLLGIVLEAKTDTQAMKVALPGSFIRLDAWNWTVGATLYAGETLGALQETIPTGADAVIRVVGFAVSADVIYFNPSSDQQTTVA